MRRTSEIQRNSFAYGREIGFILIMYFLYQFTYRLVGWNYPFELHKEVAMRNARILIAFEEVIGFYGLEILIQHIFIRVLNINILMQIINLFYMGAHVPVSLFFFFHLAYCRTMLRTQISSGTIPVNLDGKSALYQKLYHISQNMKLQISGRDYRRFRWCLLFIHILFGITIVICPMAPPRMLGDRGYVDTIVMYTKTDLNKAEDRLGVNPYAAMPSLHFTYALFVGMGYYFFAEQRWLRITGVVYTSLVGFGIVVTGNHYIMDGIMAAVYCYVCIVLSDRVVDSKAVKNFRITKCIEGVEFENEDEKGKEEDLTPSTGEIRQKGATLDSVQVEE
jgi:membrane-associated phospholipid phosphatase